MPAKDKQEAPDSQYVDVYLIHNVYVHIYICMHTYAHTHTDTHTQTHTHTLTEGKSWSEFSISRAIKSVH